MTETLLASHAARPVNSATHLLTLLGIALKSLEPTSFRHLAGRAPLDERLELLESILRKHTDTVRAIMRSRQNSFTAPRRFLVAQVVLAAYFADDLDRAPVRFADFGTGLGILPRQLNSSRLYKTFSRDLEWPGGIPEYRSIPLTHRFGVDRGPLPDLRWVHDCYGDSAYYAELYDELVFSLRVLDREPFRVHYEALDLMDRDALIAFIERHKVNVGNLSYVLYELDHERRADLISTILRNLRPPALLLVTEPHAELGRPGCDVTLYERDRKTPWRLCSVSDGHFTGRVDVDEDFERFVARYPIKYH